MARKHKRSLIAGVASQSQWLLSPIAAYPKFFLLLVVLVLVVGVGGFKAWKLVGPQVMSSQEYWLVADEIELNDPEGWILADDVKQQVLRDASLDHPLSILDADLNEQLRRAFTAHPWVARVERIQKFHPARVEIALVYRQPAAVVSQSTVRLPVDSVGVLLPVENFSSSDLDRLPTIHGIASRPIARAGNPWGDARVEGAAVIAAAFAEDWHELKLAEIVPSQGTVNGSRDQFAFELVSAAGTRIPWGRQALVDLPGEPTAAEKVERLKQYVERYGSVDATGRSALQLDALKSVIR